MLLLVHPYHAHTSVETQREPGIGLTSTSALMGSFPRNDPSEPYFGVPVTKACPAEGKGVGCLDTRERKAR